MLYLQNRVFPAPLRSQTLPSLRKPRPQPISIRPISRITSRLVLIDLVVQQAQLILQRQPRDGAGILEAVAVRVFHRDPHCWVAVVAGCAARGEGFAVPGDVVGCGDVDLVDEGYIVGLAETDARAGAEGFIDGIAVAALEGRGGDEGGGQKGADEGECVHIG